MGINQELIQNAVLEGKTLETWKRVDEGEETSSANYVATPFFDPNANIGVNTWTTNSVTLNIPAIPLVKLEVYSAKNGFIVEINSDKYVATDVQELGKILSLVKKYVEPKGKN